MKRFFSLVLIILCAFAVTSVVFAQDDATVYPGDELARLVALERLSPRTLHVAISVNNVLGNVLNLGKSPSGKYDSRGFAIVNIGKHQRSLPVVGSLPPGKYAAVLLKLEGTDFRWPVVVNPDGMFYTDFPVYMFPPGDYYMTINGVRLFKVVIPDDYAP